MIQYDLAIYFPGRATASLLTYIYIKVANFLVSFFTPTLRILLNLNRETLTRNNVKPSNPAKPCDQMDSDGDKKPIESVDWFPVVLQVTPRQVRKEQARQRDGHRSSGFSTRSAFD